jgi:hypothetical protein
MDANVILYIKIKYNMPNQTQIVNVSVSTPKDKRKKKKTRKGVKRTHSLAVSHASAKAAKPSAATLTAPQQTLQASAYNTTSAPNRPYISMMSFIASPYNNGLVPDTWSIKDMTQQTLLSMKKAEQQRIQWEGRQTATVEEVKNEIKSIKQSIQGSSMGSQRHPLSTVAEEPRYSNPIDIPVAGAGRGLNPSPFVPSSQQYRDIPPAPSSAYDDLSPRSTPQSLLSRFRNMNLAGRRTLSIE